MLIRYYKVWLLPDRIYGWFSSIFVRQWSVSVCCQPSYSGSDAILIWSLIRLKMDQIMVQKSLIYHYAIEKPKVLGKSQNRQTRHLLSDPTQEGHFQLVLRPPDVNNPKLAILKKPMG